MQSAYHQLHNDFEGDELMMKLYNWMESKKEGIKWKHPQPFVKDGVLKISRFRFWSKLLVIVSLLISLLVLLKKLRILGKLIKK